MKQTKKEIRRIYREQESTNRITDSLILKSIDEIDMLSAQGFDIKRTEKEIVDTAFSLQ